jgi:hypothetical protein
VRPPHLATALDQNPRVAPRTRCRRRHASRLRIRVRVCACHVYMCLCSGPGHTHVYNPQQLLNAMCQQHGSCSQQQPPLSWAFDLSMTMSGVRAQSRHEASRWTRDAHVAHEPRDIGHTCITMTVTRDILCAFGFSSTAWGTPEHTHLSWYHPCPPPLTEHTHLSWYHPCPPPLTSSTQSGIVPCRKIGTLLCLVLLKHMDASCSCCSNIWMHHARVAQTYGCIMLVLLKHMDASFLCMQNSADAQPPFGLPHAALTCRLSCCHLADGHAPVALRNASSLSAIDCSVHAHAYALRHALPHTMLRDHGHLSHFDEVPYW